MKRTDLHPDGFATRGRTSRGFTLVEVVVATVIVGVMILAALTTLGATARSRQVQTNTGRGLSLARHLMSEILAQAYEDPDDAPVFGREGGESGSSRADWDDVDDYHGFSETIPHSRDGAMMDWAAGWSREVAVSFVDLANMQPSGPTETGLKLVRVTVTAPNGEQTSLSGLRASFGAMEQPPPVDMTYVTWVGVEIQAGTASQPAVSGTNLLNHVEGGP
ncbi:MAG: prepilin-type N-terminal cleavage/methylation domain-containing protein [Planctomycetota bacterium]